jgi:hypothetical protein
MDIASAKEQIKNTVQIYLQKDALGRYRMPLIHQRPVFLLGAPGLGKTAIMQQIADELDIGLVSYSMTHHTRQSAIGLPIIVEKEYDGCAYSVSEYTMSEIVASVYDCMRETGKTQGILFLDEINCVSETLSPAMLLFLQYKVFGGHPIPAGWVVVTAGNPPRFNKSVREFDAATRDRLKLIEIEPNYTAWKAYAQEHSVSRCVISYLDIRTEDFYKVETTVDGLTVVTPRAWEDLSEILAYHEELGLPVGEALMGQYLQNKQVARDFAIYYELYQKYRQLYRVDELLRGEWSDSALEQAHAAKLDERMSLVSLLLESVFGRMTACTVRHDALALVAAALKARRAMLEQPGDVLVALAVLEDGWRSEAAEAPAAKQAVYLDLAALVAAWRNTAAGETPFAALRACYKIAVSQLQTDVKATQDAIGQMLRFLEEAFGKGTELSVAVNDLTTTPAATAFIGQFLSADYFAASRELLLYRQEERLLHEIDLTGLV